MHPMLNIAIRIIRTAGKLLIKEYEYNNKNYLKQKISNNYFVYINKKTEQLIFESINKFYPNHKIIRSCYFYKKKNNKINKLDSVNVQWVIDSISGKMNFIKSFPFFSISLFVLIKGEIEFAVVYDPIFNEIFSAVRGKGIQLNGYRLRVNDLHNLRDTIWAINLTFLKKIDFIKYFCFLKKVFTKCYDFRFTGSIILDFMYVVSGRLDGLLSFNIKLYDFTIGEFFIRESGGVIYNTYNYKTNNMNNNILLLNGNNVIASNCYLLQRMLSLLEIG